MNIQCSQKRELARLNFSASGTEELVSKLVHFSCVGRRHAHVATMSKQQATKLPVTSTLLLVWTGLNISSFRQSRHKLNRHMFNLFRLCRTGEISFDIAAKTSNIVAQNGNDVEATFDFVERIVWLVAFDNVAATLLLVWTGLNLAFD